MISCSDAVRQLWEYLDNDLDAEDRTHVAEHLAFCRRCCGEAEFAEELKKLLRTAARPHLPPAIETQLHSFLTSLGEETP